MWLEHHFHWANTGFFIQNGHFIGQFICLFKNWPRRPICIGHQWGCSGNENHIWNRADWRPKKFVFVQQICIWPSWILSICHLWFFVDVCCAPHALIIESGKWKQWRIPTIFLSRKRSVLNQLLDGGSYGEEESQAIPVTQKVLIPETQAPDESQAAETQVAGSWVESGEWKGSRPPKATEPWAEDATLLLIEQAEQFDWLWNVSSQL